MVAVVTVLLAAAAASLLVGSRAGPPASDPGRWAGPLAHPPGPGSAPTPAPPPTRLRIPAIEVDAPLVALGLDPDGALEPPADYHRPGWYAGGTPPGRTGPAVIAGHVDSRTGPAVFARLAELRPGDLVEVARTGAGPVRFAVTGLAWYSKHRFPTSLVYGPTPDPQLRLITCGGGFDPDLRSYTDNLVVYAVVA